jgi:hypothetical protein
MASMAATTHGHVLGQASRHDGIDGDSSPRSPPTWRFVMKQTSLSGSRPAASSMARTAGSVGGTTGSPSVHPCWKQNSIA